MNQPAIIKEPIGGNPIPIAANRFFIFLRNWLRDELRHN